MNMYQDMPDDYVPFGGELIISTEICQKCKYFQAEEGEAKAVV